MISNSFLFDFPQNQIRALITSVTYDSSDDLFVLSLLGTGSDGFNFTNQGTAWLDEEDIQTLMQNSEVEFVQELCGMQLMITLNGEQPTALTRPKADTSKEKLSPKTITLAELLGDCEEINLEGEE